jgi:hypothetical protein
MEVRNFGNWLWTTKLTFLKNKSDMPNKITAAQDQVQVQGEVVAL